MDHRPSGSSRSVPRTRFLFRPRAAVRYMMRWCVRPLESAVGHTFLKFNVSGVRGSGHSTCTRSPGRQATQRSALVLWHVSPDRFLISHLYICTDISHGRCLIKIFRLPRILASGDSDCCDCVNIKSTLTLPKISPLVVRRHTGYQNKNRQCASIP
jgi:hypothetical protein